MKHYRYYALIDGHEGAYGVVFPDLKGCCAMGETRNEAVNNALEAMHEWLSDAEKAEGIPTPRSYDALLLDKNVQEALSFPSTFILIDSLTSIDSPSLSGNIPPLKELAS